MKPKSFQRLLIKLTSPNFHIQGTAKGFCDRQYHQFNPAQIHELIEKKGFNYANELWLKKFHSLYATLKRRNRLDKSLRSWVATQRKTYKQNTLLAGRKILLKRITVNLLSKKDRLQQQWDKNYNTLQKILKKAERKGTPYIPKRQNPLPKKWKDWIENNKCRWNRLNVSQQQRLESIGIRPNVYQQCWDQTLSELKEYHQRFGNLVIVRKTHPELYVKLDYLKEKWRQGRLEPRLRRELDQMGMIWDWQKHRWKSLLGKLKSLFSNGGKYPPPSRMKKLYRWYHMCIKGELILSPQQKNDLKRLKIPIPSIPSPQGI